MRTMPQRPSPYLEPLDQPIDVYYVDEHDVKHNYCRCVTRNDILDARLNLGLTGIGDVLLEPVEVTNTPHMAV